jgi:hypothetical protein
MQKSPRTDPQGFKKGLKKGSDVYLFAFSRSENAKSKGLTPKGSGDSRYLAFARDAGQNNNEQGNCAYG